MVLKIKSVLVADGVGANCDEILKLHGISVTNKAKISKDELLREIPVSFLLCKCNISYGLHLWMFLYPKCRLNVNIICLPYDVSSTISTIKES